MIVAYRLVRWKHVFDSKPMRYKLVVGTTILHVWNLSFVAVRMCTALCSVNCSLMIHVFTVF